MNDDTCYSCKSDHLQAEVDRLMHGLDEICCIAVEAAEFMSRAELSDAIGKKCLSLLKEE